MQGRKEHHLIFISYEFVNGLPAKFIHVWFTVPEKKNVWLRGWLQSPSECPLSVNPLASEHLGVNLGAKSDEETG